MKSVSGNVEGLTPGVQRYSSVIVVVRTATRNKAKVVVASHAASLR